MHELSIATAVLDRPLEHAGGRPVETVAMRVGALRQVVPGSLSFYWEIVTRGTLCEGARLELCAIEARLRCDDCGREWEPLVPVFHCPACASTEVGVIAGDELEIEYLELKEPMHA